MSEESARLRIPYIAASQAQKHVTHNEALTLLDTLVQASVIDKDLTTPPGSPVEGDCYIVAASGTGAWTGWDNRIARYIDGEWRSYLPGAGSGEGWLTYVQDEGLLYVLNGGAWVVAAASGGGNALEQGKTAVWIGAAAFNPELANGPQRSYTSLATNLQIQDSLDFDTSTQEFANLFLKLPKKWNLGTLTFTPHWTAASGSGTVQWAVQAAVVSNDDPLNPSWGAEQTSDDTLIATGDEHIGPESAAITPVGSPAAGDALWLRIQRNVASDTLSADARLLGIELFFTSNASTDA